MWSVLGYKKLCCNLVSCMAPERRIEGRFVKLGDAIVGPLAKIIG